MTDKEKLDAIRAEVQNYIDAAHKAHTNITEGNFAHLLSFINSLQEEPVSEDLEEASKEWLIPQLDKSYANYGEAKMMELTHFDGYAMLDAIEFGAEGQKKHLWKPADGDELPEIDREVIAILNNGKVVFAHRPQESWVGVSIGTGKKAIHRPKRYGKGKWNMPNVRFWLDIDLPKRYDTTE